MASDARDRMIASTTALIRERGVEATSLSDVLAHSGAPRGSIYHHFPGGKAQLVEEATRAAGGMFAAGMVAALEADDPLAALRAFADGWRAVLRESDFAAGCPIAAVAVEGTNNVAACDAAGEAFTDWQEVLAAALRRRGVQEARAASLATLAVAAIEGAVILARAQRSEAPLERVADELLRVAEAAM
ncbi:TetR/AcrR family transcriptional regulator [Baekduia sp. Peel2402]|uniref:TetR/AcrR family transcriptional regulator n=1 Tax=Baekduia sp. Peel2402 TaxID=3458296 RepID=UPI00403E729C